MARAKSVPGLVSVAVTSAVISGCGIAGLEPLETRCDGVPTAWLVQDLGALTIDLPEAPRAYHYNVWPLYRAIVAAEGHASLSFKEPDSPRTLLNEGVREPVSAATVRAGLEMLCAEGVELRGYLRSIGFVRVRMDPQVVAGVRNSPLVDWFEPSPQSGFVSASAP